MGDFVEGLKHSGFFPDYAVGETTDLTATQRLRIEALRAASRVVAGAFAGGNPSADVMSQSGVLALAEQFLRWLEGGER